LRHTKLQGLELLEAKKKATLTGRFFLPAIHAKKAALITSAAWSFNPCSPLHFALGHLGTQLQ
ncbi:hypothetical protein K5D68_21755, partial [Pseudomonas cichorii]|nr:hypothetical protein [Pseudomonas cichorii]